MHQSLLQVKSSRINHAYFSEHEGTDVETSPEESEANPVQSPDSEGPDSAKQTATEVTFDEHTDGAPTDEAPTDEAPTDDAATEPKDEESKEATTEGKVDDRLPKTQVLRITIFWNILINSDPI